MVCADIQRVLHPYVDGELDLVPALEVESHLRGCAACGQAHNSLRALREALAAAPLRFPPPPGLRERIRSSVRAAERPAPPRRQPWRRALVAASVALVALTGLAVVLLARQPTREDRLAREVVSSHVRSLMENHLLDKKSDNRHIVKPWFTGKVDFAPHLPDLDTPDFTLLGGRLDYLDERPVAAIVYQRRQHIINLFVWPTTRTQQATEQLARQGYHLVHWEQGGMTFWAISDLNAAELEELAHLIQGKTPPGPRAP